MKKNVAMISLILVFIAVGVAGIVLKKSGNNEEKPSENISAYNSQQNETETDAVISEALSESETEETKKKYIDLRQIDITEYGIRDDCEVSEHKVTEYGNVYLVRDMGDENVLRTFVFVTTQKDIVYIDTGYGIPGDISLKFVDFYTVDLDGEDGEEIILNMNLGGVGGFGSYGSLIYKYSDGKLSEMKQPDEGYDETGFKAKLTAPYKIIVTNEYNDEKTVVDVKGKKEFFDEEGKPFNNGVEIYCDSFYEFKPVKLEDGSYGVERKQYTSLGYHMNYVGDAVTVIKFSPDKDSFEVISARFDAYNYLESSLSDA